MKEFLSSEGYLLTSGSLPSEEGLRACDLAVVFERAAVKKGFRASSISSWGAANIADINFGEDVPFQDVQEIMDIIQQVTQLSVFISAQSDILGKEIKSYPVDQAADIVRKEAILWSSK